MFPDVSDHKCAGCGGEVRCHRVNGKMTRWYHIDCGSGFHDPAEDREETVTDLVDLMEN